MSTWTFGVCDLDGTPVGEVLNADPRQVSFKLNGLDTASLTLNATNPMVDKIISRSGDVLLKVYQNSTLKFVGDLTLLEETGPGYTRILTRDELLNQAYVLPPTFPDTTPPLPPIPDVKVSTDTDSIATRGLFQGLVPSDVSDGQLRQALADAHVSVRKQAKQQITFEPIGNASEVSVAFNFAGPLWRLQHQLLGTPYTVGPTSWVDTPLEDIVTAMLLQANTNADTGIRMGTTDSLYATTYGIESSAQFKTIAEAVTEIQAAKLPYPVQSPVVYFLRELFSGSPGVVNGRTPDSFGSPWVSSGGGSDYDTTAFADARRSTATSTERIALSPYTHGSVVAGWEYGSDKASADFGLSDWPYFTFYVKYTDANNWVRIRIVYAGSGKIQLDKRVAGTITPLGDFDFGGVGGSILAATMYGIRLLIDDAGNYTVWHFDAGAGTGIGTPWFYGQDDDLSSSGPLATGLKVGFGDGNLGTPVTTTRVIDNVFASDYTGPQSFDFKMRPVEPVADTTYHPNGVKIAELDMPFFLGSLKPEVVLDRGEGSKPGRYEFGVDYDVGDTTTGRGKFNGVSRFNGLFRHYGMNVSIDKEGKVTESPTLIPDS